MEFDIPHLRATLDEKIEKTRRLYKENQIVDAGKMFGDIVPIMVNALVDITGIKVEAGDEKDKDKYYIKINALRDQGFLSDAEEKRLTKLRWVRNNFIHYYDIKMGNDEKKKKHLEDDERNFKQRIDLADESIRWFVLKAKDPSKPVELPVKSSWFSRLGNSFGSFGSSGTHSVARAATIGVPSAFGGLLSYIPFVFCTLVGMGINIFYKPESREYIENLVGGNQMPIWIGALAFLAVMFVLFFEVSFPVVAGTTLAMMTQNITGSDVAALLACMTGVLLTIGLSDRFRRTMAIVSYSFILFVGLFIAWDLLKQKQIDKGVVMDGYNTLLRIVFPIVGFISVAVVLRMTVAKNFRLLGGLIEDGVPMHMVAAAVPAAIVGFMYRSTWAKGIILLTHDYYDSKLIFWTIHIALILAVIKVYDELVEQGTIPPVNLLRVGWKVIGIACLVFSLLVSFIRRCV